MMLLLLSNTITMRRFPAQVMPGVHPHVTYVTSVLPQQFYVVT